MKISLAKLPTHPGASLDKEAHKQETKRFQDIIEDLQVRLFAENKQSLLIVLQGMDAAGKSGAIRETFKEVNPMGVRIYPFKKPTDIELAHDFLWRVHQVVPPRGMIHVFDRSHYEDVLVQRVHRWIDEDRVQQRFGHINRFEELLITENRTTILKFYLHVSEEEQLKRLEERMRDPKKMWKYNKNDMKERTYWPEFRRAYEDVFEHCSVAAPWHIVPSDENWYKEYLVAKTVADALMAMDPKYPPIDPE